MLLRIIAPHFTAGIELGGLCAPIIRYMSTWNIHQIAQYCQKKGWELELLDKSGKV